MAKTLKPPPMEITKVVVIGAGVMGAGIAAQVANGGVSVTLLDRLSDAPGTPRSHFALNAIEKLKKSNPAAFMSPAAVARVTAGNLEDDLATALADADWVIEAVIENLAIKQALYARIFAVAPAHVLVSSNTSTLPLKALSAELPPEHRAKLFIAHFFNPPRYMRLLEVVTPAGFKAPHLLQFADERLGKTLVPCKDTPGFIANRIGTFWLHAALTKAIHMGVDVETADAILGKPAGIPATGVFGLLDLVGLDLMPHIFDSFHATLPVDDPFRELGAAPQVLLSMIANGQTGRKSPKGGFYRQNAARKKEVIDLKTGLYGPVKKPKVAAVAIAKKKHLRAALSDNSLPARYAWQVLSQTLSYAASLHGLIADDIAAIDTAMRLGYNWRFGPFELLDQIGPAWVAQRLRAEGKIVPPFLAKIAAANTTFYRTRAGQLEFIDATGTYHPVLRAKGVLLLEDLKRLQRIPLLKNISAQIWDAGDKVAVLELTSKMNSLDPFALHLMNKALAWLPAHGFKALVVHNSGESKGKNFSVGANLLMLKLTAALHLWGAVDWILSYGQRTYQNLKYASIPVVSAPIGMALGGGAELLLHSQAVVAHAETYVGLVEAGVGIVPGWGGCKELLGRARAAIVGGPMPPVAKVFEIIATAQVAKSAHEAQGMLFLKKTDIIVMNPDRLLATAKAKALELAKKPNPAVPFVYERMPGSGGVTALKIALHDFARKGQATPHDVIVGEQLAHVLTGGRMADEPGVIITEDDLLKMERHALLTLLKTPATRARITHLLATGKPLRN